MALQVIGAGFGRTGTLSLKTALERLGFAPCHHMIEVWAHPETADLWERAGSGEPVDWSEIYGDYVATVDWPGCAFWRELMVAFPDAKVVLGVREPKKWWESFSSTILQQMALPPSDDPGVRSIQRVGMSVVAPRSFAGFDLKEAGFTAAFEAHNDAVVAGVPAERLLVYRVAEGWGPLCDFLGVPVPDEEFPNVNDRELFRAVFGL